MRAQVSGQRIEAVPLTGHKPSNRPVETIEQNAEVKPENGTSTLGFWLGLGILYILWDFVVLGNKKIKETINPGNIRTNLYNIILIGVAAVIFINGFKVLLVKLGALEIPGVSWLAKKLLPLFQL